ncbi:hypothetical protein ACLOJK_005602, partial [Asimina triloba]
KYIISTVSNLVFLPLPPFAMAPRKTEENNQSSHNMKKEVPFLLRVLLTTLQLTLSTCLSRPLGSVIEGPMKAKHLEGDVVLERFVLTLEEVTELEVRKRRVVEKEEEISKEIQEESLRSYEAQKEAQRIERLHVEKETTMVLLFAGKVEALDVHHTFSICDHLLDRGDELRGEDCRREQTKGSQGTRSLSSAHPRGLGCPQFCGLLRSRGIVSMSRVSPTGGRTVAHTGSDSSQVVVADMVTALYQHF